MKNLLIVDDDLTFRDSLQDLLEEKGFACVVAENGEMALDIIKSRKVDVVLTDLDLPRIDGLEVIHQISTMDIPFHPPSILMTASLDVEFSEIANLTGIVATLIKPFDLQDLIDAISTAGEPKKQPLPSFAKISEITEA